MIFTAPAKLNLYLKVIGRRSDGYHEIETLFEKISILDKISVEIVKEPTTINCTNHLVPTGGNSLLAETVRLFKGRTELSDNFRVVLEKEIPIAGGLGGGSSDAAALLNAMNEITGFPLGGEELIEIGRKLGADVPFFLASSSFGLGRDRGDTVQEIDASMDLWHIVVNAPFEVLTKDVYAKISRPIGLEIKQKLQGSFCLTTKNGLDKMFTAFLRDNDADSIAKNLCNDLQQVVLRDFPVLDRVFSELKNLGAKGALLTGSGPTIFGIFDSSHIEKAFHEAGKVFPAKESWRIFTARTYHIERTAYDHQRR